MAYSVGTAFVTIAPSFRGFQTAIGTGLTAPMAAAGTRAGDTAGKNAGKSFSSKLGTVAKAGALVMGAAAAAGAVSFVRNSGRLEAEFSKTMNKFQAAAGATSSEMKGMQALALKMGADTVFSANDASEAMLELAKSGMKPATIQAGALQSALALAAADGLSMERAATVMGNALNTFSIAGKDSAQVSNALAGAANASSASVDSIAMGLAQVGTVAADSSQTVQQTTAAIAALAQSGIAGSDAGTSLKTMFARLQPATKAAREAFESFGLAGYQSKNSMEELHRMGIEPVSSSMPDVTKAIEDYLIRTGVAGEGTMKLTDETDKLLWSTGMVSNAFVKANGEFKSVTQIAGILEKKFGDLSSSERSAALETLFGSDARRAAAVLTKEGAEGLARYVKETSNQTAAEKMAAAGMKGTAGAIEQLKGSWETLQLQFGLFTAPYRVKALRLLTDVVNGIVPALKNTTSFVKDNAVALTALGVAIAGVIVLTKVHAVVMAVQAAGGLMAMAKATRVVTAVQWALNAALTANPIGIVIAALVALGVGLVVAYKKSETFRRIVDRAWGGIKVAVRAAWNFIRPALAAFSGFITNKVGPAISWLWGNIVRPYFRAMGVAINVAWGVIRRVFQAWWSYMSNVLFPVLRFLWERVVRPYFGLVGNKIRSVWNSFVRPAFNAMREGVGLVGRAFRAAVDVIGRVWDSLREKAAGPVRFVVNTVYNNGIRKVVNAIPGVDDLPNLSFAAGGVMPGYTPGRDVHQFYSPTAGKLNLSGGEAIMRPEWTKMVGGPKAVERMNRAARRGVYHFASGGVFRPVPFGSPGGLHGNSGVDVGVPVGTPVASVASGRVTASYDIPGYEPRAPHGGLGYRSYGRVIQVGHGAFSTLYAHLSRRSVGAGTSVAGGQVLGLSGNTGNSTGPHLHFEAHGANPYSFFGGSSNYTGSASGSVNVGKRANPLAKFMDAIKAAKGFGSKVGGWFSSLSGMGAWGSMMRKMLGSKLAGFRGWVNDKVPGPGPIPSFDSGGLASGRGLVFKDVIRPERVLTPRQTESFERLVDRMGDGVLEVHLRDRDVDRLASAVYRAGRDGYQGRVKAGAAYRATGAVR